MQSRTLIAGVLLLLLAFLPSSALSQEKKRGYLGVRHRVLTDAEKTKLGLPKGGLFLSGIIKDGPAEKGGLQENDILLQCNGKAISSGEDLSALLKGLPAGSSVAFVLLRGKDRKEIAITLGVAPESTPIRVQGGLGGWQGDWGGMRLPQGGRSVIVIRRDPASSSAAALLIPPEERDASDQLLKAEAFEKNENWNDAADIYQSLMETMGDKVLSLGENTYVGVKSWCESLLLQEPPQRIQAYRENFDLRAGNILNEALAHHDVTTMQMLAGLYALTSHGERILASAASMALEGGRRSEAIDHLKKLCRLYPTGNTARTFAIPALFSCLAETGNTGALKELREIVAANGLGTSEVVINRRKLTIDRLLSDLPADAPTPASRALYASAADCFTTNHRPPSFEQERWRWTLPEPVAEQPKAAAIGGNWDDLIASRSPATPSHLLPLGGNDKLFVKGNATYAIDVATGMAATNVETDLFAHELKTPGIKPWEADTEKYRVKSNALHLSQALYLCYEHFDREHSLSEFRLCKIDELSGLFLWQTTICSSPRTTEAPLRHSLTFSGNAIVVATNAGLVASVDANSGAIRWIYTYEPKMPEPGSNVVVFDSARPETFSDVGKAGDFTMSSTPLLTYNGHVILFPTDSDSLLAIDEKNGKLVWKHTLDRKSAPLLEGIAGDKVILSAKGVLAVDVATGKALWKWDGGDFRRAGKGLLTPDSLYTPTSKGVYRVRLADGSADLVHPWDESSAGSLMTLDNATLVLSDRTIACYGSSGKTH
ncbi:MAG: hypothetical protein A2Z34_02625 [Planctomycetes bacterium RBG_16_59_8]|nr:MAG: hypothetical protein A2Z34_02625 [Planctomycetes bacterium RBG_16_59_8]